MPVSTNAAQCPVFPSGDVLTRDRTARGNKITVGIRHKGSVLKVVDASTCELIDELTFTKNKKKKHRLLVRNLWHRSKSNGSPEFVVTERISSSRLKVKVYTLTSSNKLTLVTKRNVSVSKGKVPISIISRMLKVDGTKWRIMNWKGEEKLLKRKNSLFFMNIGDMGEKGNNKTAVAAAMNAVGEWFNWPEFITTNGDNFYPPDTISSSGDSDWVDNFSDVYDLPFLAVPFYASLGNHDYNDNSVSALLAHHGSADGWNLTNNYYSITFPASSSSPLIEYFVLDTEMIDDRDSGYLDQLDWLESALQTSDARWKIVSGHHPVYSYGQHGDTTNVKNDVGPLLRSFGADVYISGHDHDKQIIQKAGDPVTYIVNGTASRTRSTTQGADSLFAADTPGLAAVQVVGDNLRLQFYDSDAQLEHTLDLDK